MDSIANEYALRIRGGVRVLFPAQLGFWTGTMKERQKDSHTATHTEKLGSRGPCTLMEICQQQPRKLKSLFYTSEWRGQVYCKQLKEEAGAHPGRSCRLYFLCTLSAYTHGTGMALPFPWT